MSERGVIYVAYGDKARAACERSIQSLKDRNTLETAVISDEPLEGALHIHFEDQHPGARWAKLNADLLSPFELTVYLDADTRPYGDISALFDILADGWDMVIATNENQDDHILWHISDEDRFYTLTDLGYRPLGLQGGMIGFRKSEAVTQFFGTWREEWLRFRDMDQGALLRALHRSPIRLWVMGKPWNNGAIIRHQFGQARRKK